MEHVIADPNLKRLSPRRAPRQARAAVTVEAILTAAAHILQTRGTTGFNTNAVAERAGVSIGSLYQYFPSKDGLLLALIRSDTRTFRDALAKEVARGTDQSVEGRISRMIDVAIAHQLDRPQLARLLDLNEKRLSIDTEVAEAQAGIAAIIEKLLAESAFSEAASDCAVAAVDVLAIARGIIDTAAANSDPDPNDLQRRVRYAVFGYLKARRADSALGMCV